MRTLRMKFKTAEDKTHVVSMNYAAAGLVAEDVTDVMQSLIDTPIHALPFAGIAGAEIVERTVVELI